MQAQRGAWCLSMNYTGNPPKCGKMVLQSVGVNRVCRFLYLTWQCAHFQLKYRHKLRTRNIFICICMRRKLPCTRFTEQCTHPVGTIFIYHHHHSAVQHKCTKHGTTQHTNSDEQGGHQTAVHVHSEPTQPTLHSHVDTATHIHPYQTPFINVHRLFR